MYWLTGLLGIISVAAPYIFRFSDNRTALWTSFIVGVVLLISSIMEWLDGDKKSWEYWVAGVTGFVAIGAPFVLGFGTLAGAVWSLVVIGAVVVAISGLRLFWGRDLSHY